MHGVALRYVEAVARLGSIRSASRRLDVSASSITRQIQAVEHHFGVVLFERGASGVRTTPDGELIIGHLRRTLFDLERTRAEVARRAGQNAQQLTLATTDSVAASFLPTLVSDLFGEAFSIRLDLRIMRASDVFEAVSSRAADVGITFGQPPSASIRMEFQKSLPLGVLVSMDHPLAKHETAELGEALEYPVVSPSIPVGLFDRVNEICVREKPNFQADVTTDSMGLIKDLVKSGRFISFRTPLYAIEYKNTGSGFVWVPIKDDPFPEDPMSIITLKERAQSDVLKSFLNTAERLLESML